MNTFRLFPILDALRIRAQVAAICAGLAKADADRAVSAAIANRIRMSRGLPISGTFKRAWAALGELDAAATEINDVLKPFDARIEALVVQAGLVGALDGWGLDFAQVAQEAAEACQAGPAGEASACFRIPTPGEPHANAIAAMRLLQMGHAAIPLLGKKPSAEGWQDPPDRMAFMQEHLKVGGNVGVVCGGPAGLSIEHGPLRMVGLDFDFTDEEASAIALGELPGLSARYGQRPKFLVAVRVSANDSYSHDYVWKRGKDASRLQILGQSADPTKGPKQFVAFGMHPDAGLPYEWMPNSQGCTLYDLRPDELSIVELDDLLARLDVALALAGWRRQIPGEAGEQADTAEALGELTDFEKQHMANWARNLVAAACKDLEHLGVGEQRGTFVFDLMLKIAPVVGAGVLSKDEIQGALSAAAVFNDVARDFERGLAFPVDLDRNWAVKELNRLRTLVAEQKAWQDAMNGSTGAGTESGAKADAHADNPFAQAGMNHKNGKPHKLNDLMSKNLPSLKFAVPRYLPQGVQLLVAPPKVGKSWLALLMALAVAEGSMFWGQECEPGDVLYLALEDSHRRLQDRIKTLRPNGSPGASRIDYYVSGEAPRVAPEGEAGGLIPMLIDWLATHPERRMIVIDVLTCIRPDPKNKRKQLYEVDYESLVELRKLAADFGVLILVIHHTRKSEGDDVLDKVSGSTGLTGSSDGILVMERDGAGIDPLEAEKQPHSVKITSRARDVRDFVIRLRREGDGPAWIYVAPTEDVGMRMADGVVVRQAIMEALGHAGRPMKLTDIMSHIGRSKTTTLEHLTHLIRERLIRRLAMNAYVLATYDVVAAAKSRLKTLTINKKGGIGGFKGGHIVGVTKELLSGSNWQGLPHDVASAYAWAVATDVAHDAIGVAIARALVDRQLWLKAAGAYWMTPGFDLLDEHVAFTPGGGFNPEPPPWKSGG